MKKALTMLATVALLLTSFGFAQNPQYPNNIGGRVMVSEYAKWSVQNLNATAVGAATMTLNNCFVSVGTGNKKIFPFAVTVPVTVVDGSLTENVTPTSILAPTALTGPSTGPNPFACSFTATFANAHSAGVTIVSNDGGLEEAINDAVGLGVGIVTVDPSAGVTAAQFAAALPNPLVQIEDLRTSPITYWNIGPGTTSFFAAPTTLTAQAACDATHSFCSDSAAVGTWTAIGSLFGCVAYVDIAGNEGPCSATASFTNVTVKAIDVGTPAASTGAVGYTIYLSLSGGTYAAAYQVPITSSICTMTTLETVTPACAVTNALYGQTGSTFGKNALFSGGAQIAATTVNTAPHFAVAGGVSTAASNAAAVSGHTSYLYYPSHKQQGVVASAYLPFTAVTTQATTVPSTMGTINLPSGFMNYLGKTIRITGKFTLTQPGSTSEVFGVYWDAAGTDTTTNPVIACNFTNTSTGTNAAWNGEFVCVLTTTAVGATGTLTAGGSLLMNLAAATTAGELYQLPESATAATGSVNLTVPARLDIISTPTGSTQTATTLLSLTLEELN